MLYILSYFFSVLPVVHDESQQRAKSKGHDKKFTVFKNPMKDHKNIVDCLKNQKGKNTTAKRKKMKKKYVNNIKIRFLLFINFF